MRFSTRQQGFNVDSVPRMSVCEIRARAKLDVEKPDSTRRGENQWGGTSRPENPAGGVSPSRLPDVRCAEQTPSGQLECNQAGGWKS